MKKADPFYKSKRWEKKREKILRRDGYECQESKRYGKRIEADTVHHIFPRETHPQYEWEDWNLISLSAAVHDKMHDRTTGKLTDQGAALLLRIARERNIPAE